MNEVINFTAADMPDNTVIFSEDIQPGESITKPARLFYVGKHKGRNYTKSDLARIVQNFNPDEEIPLQLDHSKSARDTIGFPKKVWSAMTAQRFTGIWSSEGGTTWKKSARVSGKSSPSGSESVIPK